MLHRSIHTSSSSSSSAHGVLNVYDFGAQGDGSSDDTKAFAKALAALDAEHGGVVYAPAGRFLIGGTLTIPKACTLEGTYKAPPAHAVGEDPRDTPTDGSVLLAKAGRGNESGTAFITVSADATLRGFTIFYPDQDPERVPVPYPFAVDLGGENAAVMDVECLNCFNAVRAVGAPRHYIARVQGQPANIGVYVDKTYDIGRIEDVHWNPWASQHPKYLAWQLAYGRGFVFARTDWEYVFNTFVFGMAVGYHFVESSEGSCNGNFLGIGADMAVNASVLVDSADKWGIMITNGEFTSFVAPQFGNSTAKSTQVVVSASNRGSVRFVNSAFWGPSFMIADLQSAGTTGFSDCTFTAWDVQKQGLPAIRANGTGSLVVTGCEFQQASTQVELGSSTGRAIITGNLVEGSVRVVVGSNSTRTAIANNVGTEE